MQRVYILDICAYVREVEPEEEVETDEKGPYILQSEVQNAIKEMRKKKATGDNDLPGDVLKLLGRSQRRCSQIIGRRWFENNEKIDQHRI